MRMRSYAPKETSSWDVVYDGGTAPTRALTPAISGNLRGNFRGISGPDPAVCGTRGADPRPRECVPLLSGQTARYTPSRLRSLFLALSLVFHHAGARAR